MTSFSLGFSPCPNDTFMFHALVKNKIDIGDFTFDLVIDDVESLNERAMRGELDITKISFAAFTKVTDEYELLNSGSALGRGVGPLVVSRNNLDILQTSNLKPQTSPVPINSGNLTVAIPGVYTTANFLFSLFFPEIIHKKQMLFSEIEEAVLNG